jgi:PLP dependent protein
LIKLAFLYKKTKYMPNPIAQNIAEINAKLIGTQARLIAVTKTKPISDLMEAYNANFKRYGENKVQEMVEKYTLMPKDIEWHMIGHLQSNKVKYIAPFVSMIHSVDSLKLLQEINKQAAKCQRVIPCLLQMYIATEDTKFGLSSSELESILTDPQFEELKNINIVGLMGMASNTSNTILISQEFRYLKSVFDKVSANYKASNLAMSEVSMGMSSDYELAISEGSTLIRVGSALFGSR